jgi:betaine-aldehyde dehydrogenase
MLNRQLETTEPGVFVDGAWRHGSGPSLTVIDPCTGLPLARVSAASTADGLALHQHDRKGRIAWADCGHDRKPCA